MNTITNATNAAPSQRAVNMKQLVTRMRPYASDAAPSGPPNPSSVAEMATAVAEMATSVADNLQLPSAFKLAEMLSAATAPRSEVDWETVFDLMTRLENEQRRIEDARARAAAPPPPPPEVWIEMATLMGFELPPRADGDVVVRAMRSMFTAADEVRRLYIAKVGADKIDDDARRLRYALVGFGLPPVDQSSVFAASANVLAPPLHAPKLPHYAAANETPPIWLTQLGHDLECDLPSMSRETPMPPRTNNLAADESAEQRVLAKRRRARAEWASNVTTVHRALVDMLDAKLAELHVLQLGSMRAFLVRELRALVAGERTLLERDVVLVGARWALRGLGDEPSYGAKG